MRSREITRYTKYADAEPNEPVAFLTRGGHKAPYWTRNKEWIEKNVKNPIDYVQIDHERLRLDGMEWGVSTAELENLRRLTPDVFQFEDEGSWHFGYTKAVTHYEATEENVRYCLDRAISILLRKQQHTKAKRWPRTEFSNFSPTNDLNALVFEQASQQSKVVHKIQPKYEYKIIKVVTGFNSDELFLNIIGSNPTTKDPNELIFGYLLVKD